MPKIHVELTTDDLKKLILNDLQSKLGDAGDSLKIQDVRIQVKSTQNYKAEWEVAAFRALIDKQF